LFWAGYSQTFEAVWLDHQYLSAPLGKPDKNLPKTGYVVSDDNGIVYILESGTRNLYAYPSDSIGKREICAVSYYYPFTDRIYGVETVFRLRASKYPPDCPSK
jgi:hypothetical protein